MANYDLNGVHVFNKFLWTRLQSDLGMSSINYRNLIPIIPTQQVPVFNDMPSDNPFLVYTFMISGYDPTLWANVEQVTYRIFSDNEHKIRQVTNYLVDLCHRYEWSADEVNDWLYNQTNTKVDEDDRKMEFKSIQVLASTSAEPAGSENGRQFSTVTIRIVYTHDVNSNLGNGLGMRS